MLSVLEPCAFVRVQSWDPQAPPPASLQALTGGTWPMRTGDCTQGRLDVICTGPGDWLALTGSESRGAVLQAIERACQGTSFRATDVSEALSRIRIECPQVRQILAQGCSLDLHPDEFGVGRTVRTRFAGMPVILCCRQAACFECIVSASLAEYCRAWLEEISQISQVTN